ncbi:MAG: F0F1 ATP synthase subunit delta [Hyphomicrobium sp.]|nr:F0F1 ATP synthase subunit delta [Hyphomicrobium sp.]
MASDEPLMASVAGRYASALFELASDSNSVAAVEGDLASFEALIAESPDFARMLKSPVIPADEQATALEAVFRKAGIGATTINFFKLLSRNRRLFAATDAAKAFRALAARARGEISAEVTSATPLTDAQLTELRDVLASKAGKSVALSQKVDPSILGGLVVKIGSRMIDNSLKTKLDTMRFALKGAA